MLPGSSAPQLTSAERALQPSVLICQHQSQNLCLSPGAWWPTSHSPVYGPARADPTQSHRYQIRASWCSHSSSTKSSVTILSQEGRKYHFSTQTSDLIFSNTQCVGVVCLTSIGRAAVESFNSISQSLRQLCFNPLCKCLGTYLLKQLSCSFGVSSVILFHNFLYYWD